MCTSFCLLSFYPFCLIVSSLISVEFSHCKNCVKIINHSRRKYRIKYHSSKIYKEILVKREILLILELHTLQHTPLLFLISLALLTLGLLVQFLIFYMLFVGTHTYTYIYIYIYKRDKFPNFSHLLSCKHWQCKGNVNKRKCKHKNTCKMLKT